MKKILSSFVLLSILLLTSSCTKTSLYKHDALASPNSDYATVHILREGALTHALNTLPIKFNGTNLLKIKNSSYTTVRIKPDIYEVVASFHSTKPHTETSTETYTTTHEKSYKKSKVNKSKKNNNSYNKSANQSSRAKTATSNRRSPNQNSIEKKANSRDKQSNSKYRNTNGSKKDKNRDTEERSTTKINNGNKTVNSSTNKEVSRDRVLYTNRESYTTSTTTIYDTGTLDVELIADKVYYILVRADTTPSGGERVVSTSIFLLDEIHGEEVREELKYIAVKQEE